MRNLVYLALALALVQSTSCGKTDNSKAVNSKAVKPGIALTYANDVQKDGAGAQLQRVYGIYALSRYFKVPYVHSPLKEIGYQGLAALERNAGSPDLQDKYNRVFTIPSDLELPENTISRYMSSPTVEDLEHLKSQAEKENTFYLVRILYPYSITDKNPEIYRCLKNISPFQSARSDTFRLAIHVRRGEEFVVDSQRMLPNSYYVSSAMRIVEALKTLGIPFVCELYTEVPSKAFVVTPQSHGINGRISHPVLIDPKMNRIEDFDVIPNLRKCINLDPIESLKGMATADALIISRSSFSYLAALFSKGIVIYYPFWHQPLKEWLISDLNGNISSEELLSQLKSWKRDHLSLGARLDPSPADERRQLQAQTQQVPHQ
jgi:hypothetical protein